MADIASVLHLRLEDMHAMTLTELAQWRERARVRCETDDSDT